MARARTTHDTFNAIAEPRRRVLIETLVGQEMTVGELVDRMGWKQPAVSKHLGVLKQVGLVSERRQGRHRSYQVNAVKLKPLQDWVSQFEKHWNNRFDQLDQYLEELQSKEASDE